MIEDDKKPEPDDAAPGDAPGDDALEDVTEGIDALDDEAPFDEADEDIVDEADEADEYEDDAPRLQAELDETKDRLLRAVAETENLRRRSVREREDAGKYAISGFARDLLSAIDNMRRALDSLTDEIRSDESLAGLIAGVELTERELLSAFERHGIRRIEPLGEKFDHNFHQAMFHVESPDQPVGTIVEVVQAGYVIADRLLRPAMVGVAKAANQGDEEPEGGDAAPHLDTKA